MYKVSVIIPAYNIEEYLSRCLGSVQRSENKNLQIIIVDDGSTDSTGDICDMYASKDNRIKVIHKKNGGVSSARNAAIPLIEGDWVCFIDGDDEISPDFLTIDNYNADVIEKPYKILDIGGKSTYYSIDWRESYKTKYGFKKYFVNHRINVLWNKIFSTSIIKRHRFDERFSNGEDMFFFIDLIPDIKRYGFSNIGNYVYCQRLTSATFKRSGKRELWKDYYFSCIDKLCSYQQNTSICRAILFDIYVRNMYLIYNELPIKRKKIIIGQLKSMRWTDLKLLPFKRRLRLYWWHIKSMLK